MERAKFLPLARPWCCVVVFLFFVPETSQQALHLPQIYNAGQPSPAQLLLCELLLLPASYITTSTSFSDQTHTHTQTYLCIIISPVFFKKVEAVSVRPFLSRVCGHSWLVGRLPQQQMASQLRNYYFLKSNYYIWFIYCTLNINWKMRTLICTKTPATRLT